MKINEIENNFWIMVGAYLALMPKEKIDEELFTDFLKSMKEIFNNNKVKGGKNGNK